MVNIPVSIGELLDKICILRIKLNKIQDAHKKQNVKQEYDCLLQISNQIDTSKAKDLIEVLSKINEKLWDVEDALRAKEQQKCFDENFIELARSVYIYNDERSNIKKNLNIMFDSKIVEEKSYEYL